MDQGAMTKMREEDSPIGQTISNASLGLGGGALLGTGFAILKDGVPRVDGKVYLPGFTRVLMVGGKYGLTFAAVGGVYTGVEQLLQKTRKKKDFVNGTVGAFVAGASVFGLKGRSFSAAILSGSALALTVMAVDSIDWMTRVDKVKDHHSHN